MGILKTGMKAMVAVKTADVIHERIQVRQQEQWAAHGHPGAVTGPGAPAPAGVPAAAPAPPTAAGVAPAPAAPPDTSGMLAQLTQLGELRAAGVLTDAEFETQKARILST